MATYKLAGKKRPRLPKVLQGSFGTDSDADRHDGIDCVQEAKLFRGINPEYAIPRDAINADLRSEGSPLIRLTGDEFCQNAESFLALLEDLTVQVGGIGPLTNNNGVTFVRETDDDESPLYEELVANLVSGSLQHLSIPTAAAVEVGTGSFIASIWFKGTLPTNVYAALFQYGSAVAGEQQWRIFKGTNGKISCQIRDNTNSVQLEDDIPDRWMDGRWHCAQMLVDRATNIMYLYVDGQVVKSGSISSVTNTLNNPGENLYFGANKAADANVSGHFNGSLANFHLIKTASSAAISVLSQGIRERVTINGMYTRTTNTNGRLNNEFGLSNTDQNYSTCVIHSEDGLYEIQSESVKSTNRGILELYIDDVLILTQDQYAGSATRETKRAIGIKLGAGPHIVKIKVNGKNASSSTFFTANNWLNFIKRHGHEHGGVDEFLLLGDEIMQRYTGSQANLTSTLQQYNNNAGFTSDAAANQNDYREGDIFIRGGLYQLDFFYRKFAAAGKIDLDFGSVEVLDQLDAYSAATQNAQVASVFVRLNQGRNTVRLANNDKNASAVDYAYQVAGIAGRRIAD